MRGSAATRLLGLRILIQPGAWMCVSCGCCVSSGKDLHDGLIARPEETYRLLCHGVWSRKFKNEAALARVGLSRQIEYLFIQFSLSFYFLLLGPHTLLSILSSDTVNCICIKIEAFILQSSELWHCLLSSLQGGYKSVYRKHYQHIQPWRQIQYFTPKHWHPSTSVNGVTTKKTVFKTWKLIPMSRS